MWWDIRLEAHEGNNNEYFTLIVFADSIEAAKKISKKAAYNMGKLDKFDITMYRELPFVLDGVLCLEREYFGTSQKKEA